MHSIVLYAKQIQIQRILIINSGNVLIHFNDKCNGLLSQNYDANDLTM